MRSSRSAKTYREKLHNPQAEMELYRDWLKSKRDKLSDTDADGPVALAARYEELFQDKTAAPGAAGAGLEDRSRIQADRRGVPDPRLPAVKDQWVEAEPTAAAAPTSAAGDGAPRTPRRSVEPGAARADSRRGHPADGFQARPQGALGDQGAAHRAVDLPCPDPAAGRISSTFSTRRASSSPAWSPTMSCPARPSSVSSSRPVDGWMQILGEPRHFFVDFSEIGRRMCWTPTPRSLLSRYSGCTRPDSRSSEFWIRPP